MKLKDSQPAIFDHRLLFPDEQENEREGEQLFLSDQKNHEQMPKLQRPY